MRTWMLSATAITVALSLTAASPSDPRDKIDPRVLVEMEAEGQAEFLILLEEQADLEPADELTTKEDKGRFVHSRLSEIAAATQGPLLSELSRQGVEHRGFWVVNAVWARGDRPLVESLAARPEVARIAANPEVPLDPAVHGELGNCPTGGVASGIQQLGAPAFWDAGVRGENAVIAGADTGYDWDHEALQAAYRGWDGATAIHDYNWHDAIHSSAGPCGADSPEPCDDHSHGTHTMGTMVGETVTDQLGMAPGARWIGCRNMDGGNGTPARYAECFQFFVAPTDSAGENPRPDLAPHVINNSWSCPPSEGCNDPLVLQPVVAAARAAGILVVVSAGNSGSACGSISTPAAIYDESFTVGSVNVDDLIAGSSSRGAVTVDGSDRLKPDVSARGVSVCSTVPNDNYAVFSGTSMAGPHVAGLAALLISAQPCLAGDVDTLEDLIRASAIPQTTGQACGGVPGSEVPNNTYGWGSARAVLPATDVCPGLFEDGFESGDTGAWADTTQ